MAVYEQKKYRDKLHIFQDRREAGLILASMIRSEWGSFKNSIVLAIPSGGVPVGLAISEKLGLPFDLIIVRKLQIPGNTESGFGAMTLDGSVFINEPLLEKISLSSSRIEEEKRKVREELISRNNLFRDGRPLPSLKGKSVIIADDGIASGYTMLASVHMVKKQGALKTIIAAPTAPMRSIEGLESEVDHIFCANIRTGPYFAVAWAYREWYDLSREMVLDMIGNTGRS